MSEALSEEILSVMESLHEDGKEYLTAKEIVDASDTLEMHACRAQLAFLKKNGYVDCADNPDKTQSNKVWWRTEKEWDIASEAMDEPARDWRATRTRPEDAVSLLNRVNQNQTKEEKLLDSLTAAKTVRSASQVSEEKPMPTFDDIIRSIEEQQELRARQAVEQSPLLVLERLSNAFVQRDEKIRALQAENETLRRILRSVRGFAADIIEFTFDL